MRKVYANEGRLPNNTQARKEGQRAKAYGSEEPIEVMQSVWRDALTERNGQYFLNGQPRSFEQLIITYNQWASSKGLQQLGTNPDWLAK